MLARKNNIMLIALFIFTAPAPAELITVNVTGVVDSVTTYGSFTFDGQITSNSLMNGFCLYDTDTPDDYTASEYIGHYYIDAVSMSIGKFSFIHESAAEYPEFTVWRTDKTYLADTDYASIYYNETPLSLGYAHVTLLDLCNASISGLDDHLPTSFPDISFFTYRNNFSAGLLNGGNGFTINGHLTSIEAVPEPASFFILALGAAAIRKFRA